MTELLPHYAGGRWQTGTGGGMPLFDPVQGNELVRVDAAGLNLPEAFAFARQQGGAALHAIVKVLQTHRDTYYDIATANAGKVKNGSAVDIDGGIFTLGQYARWGDALGGVRALRDGDAVRLGNEPVFLSQHLQLPASGVALFINAFNFPAWGLQEKAELALLSGVPVIVKPATATAWLTQRMVKDVVDARVLPAGALPVIAGSSVGLMDPLQPFDVVSFTGSAETAGLVSSHPAVAQRSVRANIEADTLPPASDRCCWAHAMPTRQPPYTTWRCLAPWPQWFRTATRTTRWHWHNGVRGRWSHRCMAPTAQTALAQAAVHLAASHGRVHIITPDAAQTPTGHGNVMPMSQHGGPGRAGGGAELGGLRALDFYHQRSAVQASAAVLAALGL